jgi:hypothetical protein
VRFELVLLLVGERDVGIDVGCGADLLEGEGDLDLAVELAGAGQRDHGLATAEEAGHDACERRTVVLVEVERTEGAGLLSVAVDHGLAAPGQNGVEIGHGDGLPVYPTG